MKTLFWALSLLILAQTATVQLSLSTILTSPKGFKSIGKAANNQLGWSVSGAGDINKDGYDDILVGANQQDSNKGAVYVIYGRPNLDFTNMDFASLTLIPTTTGFTITGAAAGDRLGDAVSAAGDINKDGYDDIIVGSFYPDSQRGAAYVIYGGPTATRTNIVLASTDLYSTGKGFKILGAAAADQFGYFMSKAGDVNGDGYADIIVGAPKASSAKGAAYVIYGGPTSALKDIDLSIAGSLNPATNGFSVTGGIAGTDFGAAVGGGGDINKDGFSDIIIGAYNQAANRGFVYVVYGKATSGLAHITMTSSVAYLSSISRGFSIEGNYGGVIFGRSVSNAGDVDGDGFDDIAIGAPYQESQKGVAYVLYGGASLTDTSVMFTPSPATNGITITGDAGALMGWSVSGGVDLNKDGYSDVLIGAPGKQAVYVLYGRPRMVINHISSPPALDPETTGFAIADVTATNSATTTYFGYSVSMSGDYDGNGYIDLLIGAPFTTSFKGNADVIFSSRICATNCDTCSRPTTCTICSTGYSLANPYTGNGIYCCPPGCSACASSTTCSTCGDGFYSSGASSCSSCIPNCQKCSNSASCTQCQSDSLYTGTACNQCPQGTWANTATSSCDACSSKCTKCTSGSSCQTCESGYYISSGACQSCPTGCSECTSGSVCTNCKAGYMKSGYQCIGCSAGDYYSSSSNSCQNCLGECATCSDGSTCDTCNSGYVKDGSLCVECSVGTYYSSGSCPSCLEGCATCSNGSTCDTCESGYIKVGSLCDECSDGTYYSSGSCPSCLEGCQTCSDGSTCDTCESGYVKDGSLCVECADGTYYSSGSCPSCLEGCATCSDGSTCDTCESGYVKDGSICVECSPGTYYSSGSCQACSSQCTQCTSGSSCQACESGYYVSSGSCHNCPSECQECTDYSTCTSCNNGYVKSGSQCVACSPGTYYSSGSCPSCLEGCATCSDGSTCDTCESGYIKDGSLCVECSPGTYYSSGSCQACSNKCIQCTSGSSCQDCESGYYVSSGACQSCLGGCATCSDGSSCDTCESGYVKDGSLCVGCPQKTYYSAGSCQACSSKCLQCTSGSSCQACESGFYVSAGACQSCPNECSECTDYSTCTSCSNGYVKSGLQCVACSPGTYYSSGSCPSCLEGCATCSDGSTCDTCESGYVKDGSKCVECSSGTYYSSGTCQNCIEGCHACSGGSNCDICKSGYEIDGSSQCVECLPGTYSLSGGSCQNCLEECSTCLNGSSCETCDTGYVKDDSQCVECSPGTYYSSADGSCQSCLEGCSTCVNGDGCTSCKSGYTQVDSQCVSNSCPEGTYRSGDNCLNYDEDGPEKVVSDIADGTSIFVAAISAGSSMPVYFGLMSRILRNTKYLKIQVSPELQKAFYSWKPSLSSLAPTSWSPKSESEPLPWVFERYNLEPVFLINYWVSFLMIAIGLVLYAVFKVAEKAVIKQGKKTLKSSILRYLHIAASNFALTQLYLTFDNAIFYCVLDMRSSEFDGSFRVFSLILALVVISIGGIILSFHGYLLGKYQNLKKHKINSKLQVFKDKCENVNMVFKDFKDTTLLTQSYLLIHLLRALLSSLTFVTLFDYPMLQISLLVLINLGAGVFLLIKKPFTGLFSFFSQLFCEIILFIGLLCMLIMAKFDEVDSHPLDTMERLGKCVIVLNMILLIGSAALMIIGLLKGFYTACKGPKESSKVLLKPQTSLIISEQSPLDILPGQGLRLRPRNSTRLSTKLPGHEQADSNSTSLIGQSSDGINASSRNLIPDNSQTKIDMSPKRRRVKTIIEDHMNMKRDEESSPYRSKSPKRNQVAPSPDLSIMGNSHEELPSERAKKALLRYQRLRQMSFHKK